MKLFIIQCYPYLFHARSRNFAWHLLWLSTAEGKNIVKLLSQLFSSFKFPSNFWKIAQLLGKIKNAESLRFLSLSFPSKKWSFMAMNSLWSGGKTFTPCASKTNIQRENWNYSIICFTQCTLFFRYAKFYCRFCLPCVICGTHVTRISAGWLHILVASHGLFTFARIEGLLQLWIKTRDLDYSIWATPK